jgi:hypothetical protein
LTNKPAAEVAISGQTVSDADIIYEQARAA